MLLKYEIPTIETDMRFNLLVFFKLEGINVLYRSLEMMKVAGYYTVRASGTTGGLGPIISK